MYSPTSINRICRMDYPTNKIIDFHPMHLSMIEMNDFDKDNFEKYPQNEARLYNLSKTGIAYSGISEGKVYVIFGVWELWKGVSEAWLIPSKNISKKLFAFHRGSLKFFESYANITHTKRIQITVCSTNELAIRWAEKCYFKKEGEMLHYGISGENYFLYARYF